MANKKEMEVAKGVDLKRYMGRWYEIACFPSRFQPSDGSNTRATYTLKDDDGTVHVLNETWSGGKRSYIEGTAYKPDPNSDEAKLKV
ncbi:apolipoprotein D, partial [Trifolium medium]|nr:apolipoprotein D [Trifolium medium]